MGLDPLDPKINQFEALNRWRALKDGEGPDSKGEMLFCATRDAAIHARKTDERLDELNGSTRRAIDVLNATVEKVDRHRLDHTETDEIQGSLQADVATLMDEREKVQVGRTILRSFTANVVASGGFFLILLNIVIAALVIWAFIQSL